MDNTTNNPNPGQEESLLEDVLGSRNIPREMDVDKMAVAAAGLTLPDDSDLERFVQDSIAENFGSEEGIDENGFRKVSGSLEDDEVDTSKERRKGKKKKSIFKRYQDFLNRFRSPHQKSYGLFGIPHILSTAVWLAVILAIGITLGHLGWACASDVLALGKTPQEVSISLVAEDDVTTISEKLKEAGMIRYPQLFKMFCDFTGKGSNTLVGTITFKPDIVYDYNALVNALSYRGGSVVTVSVTVPEGYSCAQIFALLEEKGVCTVSDLEAYAATGKLEDYWFIRDIERGHKYCLEGFLFPDTYEFYLDDDPKDVLEKFLDDFDYRFTSRMLDKYGALLNDTGLDLSIQEVVTIASIIEKEKANGLEGYTISSVFYNRLMNSSSYPYLNSDATLLYDENYYTGRPLTGHERATSPYNTYTQPGLPQGPIANPGLSSLDAALAPENTDYFFFVYDKNAGEHKFSKT